MSTALVTPPPKIWWAPFWRGLFADPGGKHYARMKGAIWLFGYLVEDANRTTGILVRRYETIVRDTGHSFWTVRYWIRRLREQGYIHVEPHGRGVMIEVLNWRAIGQPAASVKGSPLLRTPAKTQHADVRETRKNRSGSGEIETSSRPNESRCTKDIKRNGVMYETTDDGHERSDGRPVTREELLAHDLAHGLDDVEHLSWYRRCAARYPETLLRRLLSEARALPGRMIKRSRAALFTYLLNQHAPVDTNDPCD